MHPPLHASNWVEEEKLLRSKKKLLSAQFFALLFCPFIFYLSLSHSLWIPSLFWHSERKLRRRRRRLLVEIFQKRREEDRGVQFLRNSRLWGINWVPMEPCFSLTKLDGLYVRGRIAKNLFPQRCQTYFRICLDWHSLHMLQLVGYLFLLSMLYVYGLPGILFSERDWNTFFLHAVVVVTIHKAICSKQASKVLHKMGLDLALSVFFFSLSLSLSFSLLKDLFNSMKPLAICCHLRL